MGGGLLESVPGAGEVGGEVAEQADLGLVKGGDAAVFHGEGAEQPALENEREGGHGSGAGGHGDIAPGQVAGIVREVVENHGAAFAEGGADGALAVGDVVPGDFMRGVGGGFRAGDGLEQHLPGGGNGAADPHGDIAAGLGKLAADLVAQPHGVGLLIENASHLMEGKEQSVQFLDLAGRDFTRPLRNGFIHMSRAPFFPCVDNPRSKLRQEGVPQTTNTAQMLWLRLYIRNGRTTSITASIWMILSRGRRAAERTAPGPADAALTCCRRWKNNGGGRARLGAATGPAGGGNFLVTKSGHPIRWL